MWNPVCESIKLYKDEQQQQKDITLSIIKKLNELNIKYEDTEEVLYVDSLNMKVVKNNYCNGYIENVFKELELK